MRSSGIILFSCAGLLFSGGTIVGGSVAWNLLRMSYYFWLTDVEIELGSSVMLLAGSLLCLPACWLSTLVPYNSKSKAMCACLMGLVSVSMLMMSMGVSSMGALVRATRDTDEFNNSMLRSMTFDKLNPAVRTAFDRMQLELRCCGVNSYSDWYRHRPTLPTACCGRLASGKSGDICEVPLFSRGCLRPALVDIRHYALSLSGLSSALIPVMAATLFAAAYTMVTYEVEQEKALSYKSSNPVRIGIACLSHPLPPPVAFVEPTMPPAINIA